MSNVNTPFSALWLNAMRRWRGRSGTPCVSNLRGNLRSRIRSRMLLKAKDRAYVITT
jgi:hypothetical protein